MLRFATWGEFVPSPIPQRDVLLLDTGNTLAFLSHEAVADVVTSHGHDVDARVLVREEGKAKRHYEALMAAGVSH